MIFKRQEGFRFVFPESLHATFSLLVDGKPQDLEKTQYQCEIQDISPRGMKMFSNIEIGVDSNKLVQVEVSFILDVTKIKAIGEIVWSKTVLHGFQYGLIFVDQPAVEELIVEELKGRRKKELQAKKTS